MALSDVGEPVVQKGVAEPFERGDDIALRFVAHAVQRKARQDLLRIDRCQVRGDGRVVEDRANTLISGAALLLPLVGKHGVAKIEDVYLQPFRRLQINNHSHRRMARNGSAKLPLRIAHNAYGSATAPTGSIASETTCPQGCQRI